MKSKKKKPFIFKLAVFTVITTFIWVGFDVYRAFTIKPAPSVSAEILNPIDPTLDLEALGRLQEKELLTEEEIGDTQVTNPIEPQTESADEAVDSESEFPQDEELDTLNEEALDQETNESE